MRRLRQPRNKNGTGLLPNSPIPSIGQPHDTQHGQCGVIGHTPAIASVPTATNPTAAINATSNHRFILLHLPSAKLLTLNSDQTFAFLPQLQPLLKTAQVIRQDGIAALCKRRP